VSEGTAATRRMLINGLRPEEVRIAIVAGPTLANYQVEVADRSLTRGNVYRGVIANLQPALNAAFVDYGAERNGFLAIQDVVPEAYYHPPREGRARIDEVLEKGRPVVVQVTREPEGSKGAVLTTDLSLAGRYLVFTPFSDQRGVSRKVEDEETRRQLKTLAAALEVPAGAGVIVRTNALDQTKRDLNRDLTALLRLWKRISAEARGGKGIQLLYSDQDLILRALRDHLDAAVEEILVDDERAFDKAEEYLKTFLPRGKVRLLRYSERAPLFSRFGLEGQIERIYERTVELPGGGTIVIDRTEALVAVDVNSGRSTGAASQEETALATNLEAAREVARQLRLRDLGGLVVVDFIDMRASKHRQKVEKTLKEAMKEDKARSTVGRISANGLLEINRQKIQQALSLRTHRPCPTCAGTGRIPSPEMVGLALLRRIEARATSGEVARVRIALHPELADAFQNDRRRQIAALEEEFGIRVEVIASPHLHRPDQEIEWVERLAGDAPPPPPEPPAATAAGSASAAAGAGEGEAVPADGGQRGKKRRKRRRGKGGGGGEGSGAPAGRGDEERGAAGASAPAPAAAETSAAAAEGAAKRKRRRRRRSGRKKAGD
jgi:ribonuclease E